MPAGGLGEGSPKNLVLPVIALALPQIAYISRLTRGSMIEVLRSDFIRTAQGAGVIRAHQDDHPPSCAEARPRCPSFPIWVRRPPRIITGSVVIEQIFGVPGLGRYFVQGALNRDYTLVMGVVVFYGVLIIVFNFLVDLAYALARSAG